MVILVGLPQDRLPFFNLKSQFFLLPSRPPSPTRIPYNAPMSDTFVIHTDGGSRGNPGPAAFAYTIERSGAATIEEKGYLGETTNNIAEYTALIKALEHALDLGAKSVVLSSDSELLVQQMNGKYKVKNAGIQPLFQHASRLAREIGDVKIRHIYRDHNKRADRLCNEALDDRHSLPIIEPLSRKPASTSPATAAATPEKSRAASADPRHAAGLAILRDAAAAWADDEDDAPTPEEVWNRIYDLMTSDRPT
jgi:ribonuclease HI